MVGFIAAIVGFIVLLLVTIIDVIMLLTSVEVLSLALFEAELFATVKQRLIGVGY